VVSRYPWATLIWRVNPAWIATFRDFTRESALSHKPHYSYGASALAASRALSNSCDGLHNAGSVARRDEDNTSAQHVLFGSK
jgi:hypothetical protein